MWIMNHSKGWHSHNILQIIKVTCNDIPCRCQVIHSPFFFCAFHSSLHSPSYTILKLLQALIKLSICSMWWISFWTMSAGLLSLLVKNSACILDSVSIKSSKWQSLSTKAGFFKPLKKYSFTGIRVFVDDHISGESSITKM